MVTPRIVVDSGPLLTYLALRYPKETKAGKGKRDAVFSELRGGAVFTETDQERLVKAFNRVLTTSHVIAEVFKLRESTCLYKEAEAFRESSLKVLARDNIEEIPCPFSELIEDDDFRRLICRFGVTDAGLVFIAAKQKALLLTDDRRLLADYSAGAGYKIRLLDEWLRE